MFEPQELRLEQEPAVTQPDSIMYDDIRQQLEGIRQQLVELRKEVGDTRQQLAHMQAQVSTLYGRYIDRHSMRGMRRGAWLVSVMLAPWRWLVKGMRWGKPQGAWLVSVMLTPWRWLVKGMRWG